MVIIWSKTTREDLRLIHQCIAHDSKRYATCVITDITEKVEILRDLPRLGRVVPEIAEENVREIGLHSYRIVYELIGETLYIHGVIHRRRHLKPDDLQRG